MCVSLLCVWGSVIVDLCIFPTIEIFSITCSCVFVSVIVLLCFLKKDAPLQAADTLEGGSGRE